VTAQLINAEDGYHLWSERYDRELTDVFAIQDDIAQAIAGALQLKLIAKPARHTPNFPAYEALLKARHHLRSIMPEAFTRATEYCEQAIALDPEYAAPHALLGLSYLFAATSGRPMREVAPLIRREARRALEMDPFETDPHFLLGSVAAAHDYNWPEAAREFQLAMANPSVPAEARWAYASWYLNTFGRFEESAAEMRRAVEQDPLNVSWRGILVAYLVCAGRYEEALQEGLKALDIGAQNELMPHLTLGEVYLALGRVAEAVASAERAHRNFPQQSMAIGLLAASLIRLGEKDRAEALLREMGDSPTPIWGRAWYHLLCSEVDAAAGWYEKMIDARDVFAVVYANSLYTEELRASPHWAKLARMMNLPESVA
jgi:tetratricopeptide (TPR) repeat protein